jgi:hypothetical protein
LFAQRRLAHVERIGRTAEVAKLRHSQESLEQFDFHSVW